MTIRKNIAVVPSLLGWTADADREAHRRPAGDHRPARRIPGAAIPRQLSGGEQQRIGLARALAADPAILLMDEPFAAVDAINRERLQAELLEIHAGCTKPSCLSPTTSRKPSAWPTRSWS